MKPSTWIVGGLLLLAVVAFTLWRSPSWSVTPPGQYPLDEKRPQWPATRTAHPYKPATDMGSDAPPLSVTDVKFTCGVSDVCVHPTA